MSYPPPRALCLPLSRIDHGAPMQIKLASIIAMLFAKVR